MPIRHGVPKLDDAPTNGLNGVVDSAAYRIHAVEKHHHNRARFWGAVASPTETNAIEANVDRPFVAPSGANTWGTAIPILGTADDPTSGDGDTLFDIHRFLVASLDDQVDAWRLRIICGTGTSGDAISAEQWSEVMLQANASPGNRAGGTPIDSIMPRVAVGWKLWAQAWNDTNEEEMAFFWGCHGYPA